MLTKMVATTGLLVLVSMPTWAQGSPPAACMLRWSAEWASLGVYARTLAAVAHCRAGQIVVDTALRMPDTPAPGTNIPLWIIAPMICDYSRTVSLTTHPWSGGGSVTALSCVLAEPRGFVPAN